MNNHEIFKNMQTDLFTSSNTTPIPESPFRVHAKENNPESQSYLEAGIETFSKNCETLFKAFMDGDVINTLNSPVNEFRRRRQDLTDEKGVHLTLHSSNGRIKNWYMTPDDMVYNKKFIK